MRMFRSIISPSFQGSRVDEVDALPMEILSQIRQFGVWSRSARALLFRKGWRSTADDLLTHISDQQSKSNSQVETYLPLQTYGTARNATSILYSSRNTSTPIFWLRRRDASGLLANSLIHFFHKGGSRPTTLVDPPTRTKPRISSFDTGTWRFTLIPGAIWQWELYNSGTPNTHSTLWSEESHHSSLSTLWEAVILLFAGI